MLINALEMDMNQMKYRHFAISLCEHHYKEHRIYKALNTNLRLLTVPTISKYSPI